MLRNRDDDSTRICSNYESKKGEFDALNPIRLEQLEYKIQPVFHPLFEMPNVYEEGHQGLLMLQNAVRK
jgi:hypothetical protein